MITAPLVSICIPVFNGEKYLRECLDSAISQTYRNIEIVVVDDQSADKTNSIVSEYQQKDNRIKFYRNSENLGLVGNWNKCLDYSKGEWIKFLFQDDYLSEKTVEQMMQFAFSKNRFVVCDRNFVFEEGVSSRIKNLYSAVHIELSQIFRIKEPSFISPKRMSGKIAKWKHINYIGEPSSVLFHKSIVNEIGYFNPLLAQHCDLEFWFRISSIYGLFYIPERLVDFRVHEQSTSSSNRKSNRDIIDIVVISYELCFGKLYQQFRKNINSWQLMFLKQFLIFRIHVLRRHIKRNHDENMERDYQKLAEQIPYLKTINYGIIYYLIQPIVLLRRGLLQTFKMTTK